MSESIPGIPGGFVPPGIREVPHSDLVSGLFREVLSRSAPASPIMGSVPDPGYSAPPDASVDIIHEYSAPVLTAPIPTELNTNPELNIPMDFNEQSTAEVEPSLPEDHSRIQKNQTENTEESLDLSEGSLPEKSSKPLAPPPIHRESPNDVILTNQEPQSPTEAVQTRRELPFGEPYGPELCTSDLELEKGNHGSNSSGLVLLNEYSTGPSAQGFSNAPDYYFIGKEQPDSVSRGYSHGNANPIPTFDLESVRNDFPALHQQSNGHPLVFLDNAATTQKPQAVIDATSHFYSRDNTNIHRAAYELAERATAAFEKAREKVSQFLGAKDKKEIVFVRGATEAINLVANTFGRKFIGEGDEILLTTLEHHANIVPWQLLAKQVGAVLKVVPINDRGELILEEYVRLLSPRTKLVSVTHVSNALGTVNPVEQIIQLAHARGVHVLVDGSQSTPHLPVNVQSMDADFFVFSGHKVFGPTGIGALYGKSHLLEVLPPWQGGGHMIKDVTFERTIFQHAPEKFEAGTPDIAGAVGLGAAIDYLFKIGIPKIAAYEHSLLEYATERLSEIPGIRPIGTALNKASVLSFVIPGIPNETIASHLDKRGIAVRAGHHCALPAIRHFGLESSVRPSLAFYNNRNDVDALVSGLHALVRNRL